MRIRISKMLFASNLLNRGPGRRRGSKHMVGLLKYAAQQLLHASSMLIFPFDKHHFNSVRYCVWLLDHKLLIFARFKESKRFKHQRALYGVIKKIRTNFVGISS